MGSVESVHEIELNSLLRIMRKHAFYSFHLWSVTIATTLIDAILNLDENEIPWNVSVNELSSIEHIEPNEDDANQIVEFEE